MLHSNEVWHKGNRGFSELIYLLINIF